MHTEAAIARRRFSDDWYGFWADASERMRALELYDAMFPPGSTEGLARCSGSAF